MSLDLEAMFTKVQRMWAMFADNPVFSGDATKFLNGNGTYTAPAGTVAAPIANSIAADVALNNTSNFFTGPTVAQGSTGTWFASGTVCLVDTAGAAVFLVKLWDGTTVIDSAFLETAGANVNTTVSLSGFLATPAGNLRISVRDTSSTSGAILADETGSARDSTLTAFRIA